MDHLVPSPQHEAKGPRHAVPAHRKLPHLFGHLPDAVAAGGKKRHVAGAEAMNLAVFVGDEYLAGNDVHGLIDGVIPFEPAWRAPPRPHRPPSVGAFRQAFGARLRLAFDDPIGINGVGAKLDVGWSGEDDGLRHSVAPLAIGPLGQWLLCRGPSGSARSGASSRNAASGFNYRQRLTIPFAGLQIIDPVPVKADGRIAPGVVDYG